MVFFVVLILAGTVYTPPLLSLLGLSKFKGPLVCPEKFHQKRYRCNGSNVHPEAVTELMKYFQSRGGQLDCTMSQALRVEAEGVFNHKVRPGWKGYWFNVRCRRSGPQRSQKPRCVQIEYQRIAAELKLFIKDLVDQSLSQGCGWFGVGLSGKKMPEGDQVFVLVGCRRQENAHYIRGPSPCK